MEQTDENPENSPFLFKIYVQESHQNLEAICDTLGKPIIMLYHLSSCNCILQISGYSGTLRKNELQNKAAFVIQDVGINCCGKPCLTYRFINQFGWIRVARNFDVNDEFSEYIYGNGRGKSLITLESNKIIHIHRGKRVITMTKEFDDASRCIMTTEIDGIVSKRVFKFNGQLMYGNRNLV